jgi:hypothetical protein
MIVEMDYLQERRRWEWMLSQDSDLDIAEQRVSEKTFVMKESMSQNQS